MRDCVERQVCLLLNYTLLELLALWWIRGLKSRMSLPPLGLPSRLFLLEKGLGGGRDREASRVRSESNLIAKKPLTVVRSSDNMFCWHYRC